MTAKAYVLMQTEARRVEDILSDASHIPGVRAAEAIHGSYDVLVTVEDDSEADITRHITRPLGTIDGVIRTTTCFVLPAR